jgi:L,D-peptidoglycan transpeptidase YkuD (ErfK/YbiS/YcfS/YnhG family)
MWLAALIAGVLASPIPAESRQLVLVTSAGWDATQGEARLYERDGAGLPWHAHAVPVPVSLGRAGLAWGRGLHAAPTDGPLKKEGDGRSPAGVFELREATGYEPQAPAGARLPYREATPRLRCVDDAASSHYNRLVDEGKVPKDWTSAEDMRRPDGLYRLVVWVGHNDRPPTSGGGSCIFLHLRDRPDATTAGCTAFDDAPLERLLRWLDPKARPVLVQLPAQVRAARSAEWGLPLP